MVGEYAARINGLIIIDAIFVICDMDADLYLIMALLPLILIPPLIYYRQRVFNKKSKYVSAQCPHCMSYQDILGVQNYSCKKCSERIEFYDELGNPHVSMQTYACIHCEKENFKGILTCVSCGLTNKAGIPS
ncbi:MAG: hypothetical protein ACJA0X_000906 [Cyclobacteriaceae bacterium]